MWTQILSKKSHETRIPEPPCSPHRSTSAPNHSSPPSKYFYSLSLISPSKHFCSPSLIAIKDEEDKGTVIESKMERGKKKKLLVTLEMKFREEMMGAYKQELHQIELNRASDRDIKKGRVYQKRQNMKMGPLYDAQVVYGSAYVAEVVYGGAAGVVDGAAGDREAFPSKRWWCEGT
ncbi:hypothetical protein AMTR_s00180p00029090 [Amborella trichopoda]|uniref:Uncharacterized protein n=1 Tax=Amborella trichopoda TaxID=13333 RepID=W1PXT3_AMBTC|nr:hypothetical protein AMTR_s00180p00029090 [Amborella trichopoda]